MLATAFPDLRPLNIALPCLCRDWRDLSALHYTTHCTGFPSGRLRPACPILECEAPFQDL